MTQADTSVLYNDFRGLHVSVKGSSVSNFQKLERGNVFTEILTTGCSVDRTGAKLKNCKGLRTIYIILCIKKNINIQSFCLCITLVLHLCVLLQGQTKNSLDAFFALFCTL